MKAIADFTGARFASADNPELSFKRGDTFTVLEADEVAGWARGQIHNVIGWFPLSYVEFVEKQASDAFSSIEKECVYSFVSILIFQVLQLEQKEKELCDQEQELKNQLNVVLQQKKDLRTKKAELKAKLEESMFLSQNFTHDNRRGQV